MRDAPSALRAAHLEKNGLLLERRMTIQPMFVFSMPRSGSTLLQRMLVSHAQVTSASEPWFLLPLAVMSGETDLRVFAEYSQRLAAIAVADLVACMTNGQGTYREILRETALRVYQEASAKNARYFIDKTPRYFLIIDFIMTLFPDAKAILLVRDPLDVLASVITTWGNDRLWLHHALLDLYHGPLRLHEAGSKYSSRLLRVRYEDLVARPETTCEDICAYLELPFEPQMLKVTGGGALAGRMGDKSPNSRREGVIEDSVGRWRGVLATPVRRWFARRYLRRLGPDVLRTFGVEADAIDAELVGLPVRWKRTGSDAVALASSFAATRLALAVTRDLWRTKRGLPSPKID